MDKKDITVTPVEEYDVDVRETLEQKLEHRGFNASFSTYKQPMLVATMRKEVNDGEFSTYKVEMPQDVICTQEELDEMIEDRIDEVIDK